MMRWEVTEDGRWLQLMEWDDELDLKQVDVSFTREVSNWHFLKKQSKHRSWDGKVPFFYKHKYLAAGLWMELLNINEKYNLGITVYGLERIIDTEIKFEDFRAWALQTFKMGIGGDPAKPIRPYQIEAAYKILKYRLSSQELATNAGKTFITYMVVAYLFEKKICKRLLMVVPTTTLVIQGVEDFQDYGSHKYDVVFQQVHGESKRDNSDANVAIGTWQSIVNKDPEWLATFDIVFVDEAHGAPAKSIKNIVSKCVNSIYRFGLSGTLTSKGKESADFFTIQMCVGPMVGKVTPDFLIQNDYAAPVDIRIIKMHYLPEDARKRLYNLRKNKTEITGSEIFQIERKLVIQSYVRLKFITEFIIKSSKNSLVLFQSVEEGYGRAIYDRIRELTNDREVFYIDGDTKDSLRNEYKTRLKEGEGKIMVASYGTLSTGISINNIHNIYFVESYKSENIIKQSIGRGLRKHADKDKVRIIDFVDDFSYKANTNYLLDHSTERINIYDREKFPYVMYDIDLFEDSII